MDFRESWRRFAFAPAMAVALVDGPETVWARGFGLADLKASVAATASTVFRVGSVSKLLTDIAVMQLLERGRLDLDRDLRVILPDHSGFRSPSSIATGGGTRF